MGVVHIAFELWCDWTDDAPVYRVYVDNHLMTERTYIFNNKELFIEEHVPLMTTAGKHYLKIENLNPKTAKFTIKNFKINEKPGVWREMDGRFVLNQDDVKV